MIQGVIVIVVLSLSINCNILSMEGGNAQSFYRLFKFGSAGLAPQQDRCLQNNPFLSLPVDLIIDVFTKSVISFDINNFYDLKKAIKFFIKLRRIDKYFYVLMSNGGIGMFLRNAGVNFNIKRSVAYKDILGPSGVCRVPLGDRLLETLEQWALRKKHEDCIEIVRLSKC